MVCQSAGVMTIFLQTQALYMCSSLSGKVQCSTSNYSAAECLSFVLKNDHVTILALEQRLLSTPGSSPIGANHSSYYMPDHCSLLLGCMTC